MKLLFPKVIPQKVFVTRDVLEVHVVESEEVRVVPISPTVTNNGLEVVEVEDSSFFTTGEEGETNKGYENYV